MKEEQTRNFPQIPSFVHDCMSVLLLYKRLSFTLDKPPTTCVNSRALHVGTELYGSAMMSKKTSSTYKFGSVIFIIVTECE